MAMIGGGVVRALRRIRASITGIVIHHISCSFVLGRFGSGLSL
jgi:hypothetical protein